MSWGPKISKCGLVSKLWMLARLMREWSVLFLIVPRLIPEDICEWSGSHKAGEPRCMFPEIALYWEYSKSYLITLGCAWWHDRYSVNTYQHYQHIKNLREQCQAAYSHIQGQHAACSIGRTIRLLCPQHTHTLMLIDFCCSLFFGQTEACCIRKK